MARQVPASAKRKSSQERAAGPHRPVLIDHFVRGVPQWHGFNFQILPNKVCGGMNQRKTVLVAGDWAILAQPPHRVASSKVRTMASGAETQCPSIRGNATRSKTHPSPVNPPFTKFQSLAAALEALGPEESTAKTEWIFSMQNWRKPKPRGTETKGNHVHPGTLMRRFLQCQKDIPVSSDDDTWTQRSQSQLRLIRVRRHCCPCGWT